MLDGLPLAIELAAARLRVLSPADLADRISGRLAVLGRSGHGGAPHHATLEATIAWSYDLLSPSQQRLFRRLSAFAGSFSFDAVEAICCEGPHEEIEVIDALDHLVDASMVRAEHEATTRYRLLETLRQYGVGLLDADGEAAHLAARHARYYRESIRGGGAGLAAVDQARWMAGLDDDQDNLRRALDWALDADDLDLAVGLTGDLARYWYRRGLLTEAQRWLDAITARNDLEPSVELAAVLRFAIALQLDSGSTSAAGQLFDREAEVAEAVGDSAVLARSLNLRAGLAWRGADPELARQHYRRAAGLLEGSGDALYEQVLINEAFVAVATGDLDGAETLNARLVERSVGAAIPEQHRLAGEIAFAAGRLDEARQMLVNSVAEFRTLELPLHVAKGLQTLSRVELVAGELEAARAACDESLDLYGAVDDRFNLAQSAMVDGELLVHEGAVEQGIGRLFASLDVFAEDGRVEGVIDALLALAAAYWTASERASAAASDTLAMELSESSGFVPPSPIMADQERRLEEVQAAAGSETDPRLKRVRRDVMGMLVAARRQHSADAGG
jgi:non-specific serine/threonine protein kinase